MINVIGAGLAGLSAAITAAKQGIEVNLISQSPSERAQSVMAEGGINVSAGPSDSAANHAEDTLKAGRFLEDKSACETLAEYAPQIVEELREMGAPLKTQNGQLVLRPFGGQKIPRTAYAKSSTGKILMTALIDEARRYEVAGLIKRYANHEFKELILDNKICVGVTIQNRYTNEILKLDGPVILCSGGLTGFFLGGTTGSVQNTGDVTAKVFSQGVKLSNLEMIQYHPTTIGIPGKRMLVSEAARGEGGRLCVKEDGVLRYFMEEKYPESGNLSPRDVISREMAFIKRENPDAKIYLDLTGLSEDKWQNAIPDLRAEIIDYTGLDPKTDLIEVSPGIHYFMGGINVDETHQTNIENLYAAGECCSRYHGANRLGGNSMLGALTGGKIAANAIAKKSPDCKIPENYSYESDGELSRAFDTKVSDILKSGLGILRTGEEIENAVQKVKEIKLASPAETNRKNLALAILMSADLRRESRGAHYRLDFPEEDENCRKKTEVEYEKGEIKASFGEVIK